MFHQLRLQNPRSDQIRIDERSSEWKLDWGFAQSGRKLGHPRPYLTLGLTLGLGFLSNVGSSLGFRKRFVRSVAYNLPD